MASLFDLKRPSMTATHMHASCLTKLLLSGKLVSVYVFVCLFVYMCKCAFIGV